MRPIQIYYSIFAFIWLLLGIAGLIGVIVGNPAHILTMVASFTFMYFLLTERTGCESIYDLIKAKVKAIKSRKA
ncbi:MAG: hypothetical protein HDS50_05435 [Bacteroides sp.]|nr:hypothetical protein [Bacteroides sp.]MBD5257058.1 hypothetical protein [Bacteroides sp.]